MQTNIQNIYIDTCFFQGYLWGKEDEKKNANVILSKIKSNVRRNPEINVRIPFIVVGELINNLIRENFELRDSDEIIYKFFVLRRNLKADIIPPNKCCYDIAKSLTAQDSYFAENAPTDAFMASCALCDPDSSHLLTVDSRLLESELLKSIEKEIRTANKRNPQLNNRRVLSLNDNQSNSF